MRATTRTKNSSKNIACGALAFQLSCDCRSVFVIFKVLTAPPYRLRLDGIGSASSGNARSGYGFLGVGHVVAVLLCSLMLRRKETEQNRNFGTGPEKSYFCISAVVYDKRFKQCSMSRSVFAVERSPTLSISTTFSTP
jgi:hypothetical protein